MVEPSDAGAGKVRPLRQDSKAAEERVLWARFREAATPELFYESWLALQCRAIEGVEAGLVLASSAPGGALAPLARWRAERRPGRHLLSAAERVLQERRALALEFEPQGEAAQSGLSRTVIAQSIEAGGELVGVVALDVAPRPEAQLEGALRQLT